MLYVDDAKCTGCGACIEVCSTGAISLKDDKAFVNQELCTECGNCLSACPVDAICQPGALVATPEAVSVKSMPGLPAVNGRRSKLVGAFASLIPVAVDVISDFASRWLARRGQQSNLRTPYPSRGMGHQRRRRGRQK
jgi:Fe-S-cluster-containing hydrogenase component 2